MASILLKLLYCNLLQTLAFIPPVTRMMVSLPDRSVTFSCTPLTQNSRPLGVCRCVFLGKSDPTITAGPARFASVLMQNCYCIIKLCKRNDQTRINNGSSRIANVYSKPSHTHDFLYSPMQTSLCYLLSHPDSALHCLHLHVPNFTTSVPCCLASAPRLSWFQTWTKVSLKEA